MPKIIAYKRKNMKTIQRYSALIWFTVLFVVGLLIRYLSGESSTLWGIWSAIDVAFAVVLGILAFIAYQNIVRDEDQIRLVFNIENKREVDTGLCLLRKNCTRSEVIGVVTMMKHNNEHLRYDVANLHNLLDEINQVQTGTKGKLHILINEDEFSQFDIKEYSEMK